MLQHFLLDFFHFHYGRELETGKKYHFLIKELIDYKIYLTIKATYVNKNIALKFRVFGLNQNKSIVMLFDENRYELNSNSLEIKYDYKQYNPNLIVYFIKDEVSKNVYVEIKVGFLKEDLNSYKQVNFEDAIGKLTYNKYNGVIIKISRDLKEHLFNYILVVKDKESNIEITYDTLEYAVPLGHYKKLEMFPLIELFKSNPYSEEMNDTNKFFFITVYNGTELLIKKPKIFNSTSLEFYKINLIPKLINENQKYFYRIELPKDEHSNYMKIQTLNEQYYNYISFNQNFYREINNFYYETYCNSFNEENSQSLFINYFDLDTNNYINLIPQKDYDFININNLMLINYNVEQIDGKNEIRINSTSLAYHYNPNKYYYHLFININCSNSIYTYKNIVKYISGDEKPDKSKKQKLFLFEDDGSKERIIIDAYIEKDEIFTNLSDNIYFIVPVNKDTNLIEYNGLNGHIYRNFNFRHIDYLTLALIVAAGAIALIIITVVIVVVVYKRKINKEKKEKLNEENIDNINSSMI